MSCYNRSLNHRLIYDTTQWLVQCWGLLVHPYLCNINFNNVTHSLISWNPREWMFVVQISFLIVTFLSLISYILSLMQTTQEVNSHPCIALCVIWSVFFSTSSSYATCWMLVHAYVTSPGKAKWSGPHHIIKILCIFIVSHATLIL
jgi:hypothetical protein